MTSTTQTLLKSRRSNKCAGISHILSHIVHKPHRRRRLSDSEYEQVVSRGGVLKSKTTNEQRGQRNHAVIKI